LQKENISKEKNENAKITVSSCNDRKVFSSLYYITRNINRFTDAVRIKGGVLISYLSGAYLDSAVGILVSGQTLSTNALMLGIQACF